MSTQFGRQSYRDNGETRETIKCCMSEKFTLRLFAVISMVVSSTLWILFLQASTVLTTKCPFEEFKESLSFKSPVFSGILQITSSVILISSTARSKKVNLKAKIIWIISHFMSMLSMIFYFVFTPSCSSSSTFIIELFYVIMALNFCFTSFMFLAVLQLLMESCAQTNKLIV